MTFAVYTLGCKVNIYESEYVINKLKENNYKLVDISDKADIYIINTCSVTNEADKKDRKIINRLRRENPESIIVVMGCHIQAGNKVEGANIVIGNKDKSEIVNLIKEYKETKDNITRIYDLKNTNFEDMCISNFDKHTRAFVKIQDGCNAFCSYCIIPYVRGNIRSKDFDKVVSEVTNLVNSGYKEIVLTGIHTGRYGIDNGTNLSLLLNRLVLIPNIYRIRLSSIEINEITDEIIDLIKNNKIMAKHLHIPLQSGSDHILKLMNRKYDVEYFINKVNRIRAEIPDISITTDLILGFPYEDDKYYKETLNTINKIKFTKIHTFPYSRRKGTKADAMPCQVDNKIKKQRVREVIEISNKCEEEFYKKYIGKTLEVLTEGHNNHNSGYTSNYIPVVVNNSNSDNLVISVRITEYSLGHLQGDVLEEISTK